MQRKNTFILSRRTLIRTAAAFPLVAAPALISRRSLAADDKILYVNTWGGAWTAAQRTTMFAPFTAKTGIEIKVVEPVSFPKLKATVDAKTWDFDVTSFASVEYFRAKNEGLVEPMDWKLFDKSKVNPACLLDEGVKSIVLGTPFIYRKDKYPNPPKSWADFFDVQKFPGFRALNSTAPQTTLAFALLADGVPKDKLYPLDLDRAFKKLNTIKSHIKVWWTQTGQSEQIFRDGEVDMMSIWSSRIISLMKTGVPVDVVWEGSQNDTGVWFMVKGTPRKEAAVKWMEFLCEPKPHGEFCEAMTYGPSNPDALKFMSPEAVAMSPSNAEHEKQSFQQDAAWVVPNLPKIQERFQEWMTS